MTPSDILDKGYYDTAKHIDFDVVINSALYNSAVSMLSNVTKTGYAEMQESNIEDTEFDYKYLPTYHMLKNIVLK